MKANRKIIAVLFVLVISSVIFSKQVSAQSSQVSFQVFYNQLSPYGQWVDYLNYGDVWVPNVGSDFVPYSTDGHWVLTNYGWAWVSDYAWGWAPFHYGRWGYDNSLAWFWVPDTEWGPSWVSWRSANDYYGWAPMAPGVSINGNGTNSYNDHWMFVRRRDIGRSNINRYYVKKADQERIMQNSTLINKTYTDNKRHTTYVSGPAREDVQKATGKTITPIVIRNNKQGQILSNGQLRIYRPIVTKNKDQVQDPTPSKMTNLQDVKTPSERIATNKPQNISSQNTNNKIQQQKVSKPVNANSMAKPAQRQQTNQSRNNRLGHQPNNVQSLNNNNKIPQQKNSKQANPNSMRPAQHQQTNQSHNNGKIQQQNRTRPQTNLRQEPPKEVKHP